MAKRSKQLELKEANLSFEQMKKAIRKIDRRLKDLGAFDIESICERCDPKISTLKNSLDALLVSVFGKDTVEYKRYRYDVTKLDTASINCMYSTPIDEVKRGLVQGKERSMENLKEIKRGFLEELEDSGRDSGGKTLKAYEGLELHPAVERAVGKLFKDGHYANAIEDAVKVLNNLVRLNSGFEDKDGSSLMEHVFSPKKPILKFNDLKDQSDSDEQKGYMMMFSGAVAGLRNPRAHKIIEDDPERALEFIAFISLLAKLADKAEKIQGRF